MTVLEALPELPQRGVVPTGRSAPPVQQQWLFPTNVDSGRWDDEDRALGTRGAVVSEASSRARSDWPLSNGYSKMRPGDVVWIYGSGALLAAAIVDEVYQDPRDDSWRAIWTWRQDITAALQRPELELSRRAGAAFRFTAVPRSPHRVDPQTASIIDAWVDASSTDPAGPDLRADPELSDDDNRLRRFAEQTIREGAAAFRSDLMTAYEGRCAFSGCSTAAALEAAHIKAYRGPRHNRIDNGILLRRDLHALFDADLIGVTESGRIYVSEQVRQDPTYTALHDSPFRRPRLRQNQPRPEWLADHLQGVLD